MSAHYVKGDALRPIEDLPGVLAFQDEPFDAPNLFLHWGLYAAARTARVTALLDGIDGDRVISHGIGLLRDLARSGRWVRLGREIAGLSGKYRRPARQILKTHVLGPWIPEFLGEAWRGARGRRSRFDPPAFVRADFARRTGLRERIHAQRSLRALGVASARAEHLRALVDGRIAAAVEVADRAAAAFSIEPRYPFLDRRVVEFSLGLASEQKLDGGWTRMVMRRAMEGILPPAVQWRPGKTDLSANFVCRLIDAARPYLGEHDSGGGMLADEFMDAAELRRARQGVLGASGENDAFVLWKAAVLEAWLRGGTPPVQTASRGEANSGGKQYVERSEVLPFA
jgi:asparagine synthase (glutamine-hydrolysing)